MLRKHLASGKSGLVEIDGRQTFLTVQVPPVRLVVIGAVHISQAMAPMVAGLDLALTVIDPRTAFASQTASRASSSWPNGRTPPSAAACRPSTATARSPP